MSPTLLIAKMMKTLLITQFCAPRPRMLFIYGMNYLFLTDDLRRRKANTEPPQLEYGHVTVQLPIYNEMWPNLIHSAALQIIKHLFGDPCSTIRL
jgi:hypothetical protein